MRWILIGLLVAIFASLASGLFFLMRDKGNSTRTLTALSWRIGLSIAVFILALLLTR